MHNSPRWITHETWVCFRHIPMAKIPAVQKTCWYCKDDQPSIYGQPDAPPKPKKVVSKANLKLVPKETAPKIEAKSETTSEKPLKLVVERCSWTGCQNKAAENSKYCSRQCSNKNARARAAERKATSATT